jgi:hypothetical protein
MYAMLAPWPVQAMPIMLCTFFNDSPSEFDFIASQLTGLITHANLSCHMFPPQFFMLRQRGGIPQKSPRDAFHVVETAQE